MHVSVRLFSTLQKAKTKSISSPTFPLILKSLMQNRFQALKFEMEGVHAELNFFVEKRISETASNQCSNSKAKKTFQGRIRKEMGTSFAVTLLLNRIQF